MNLCLCSAVKGARDSEIPRFREGRRAGKADTMGAGNWGFPERRGQDRGVGWGRETQIRVRNALG